MTPTSSTCLDRVATAGAGDAAPRAGVGFEQKGGIMKSFRGQAALHLLGVIVASPEYRDSSPHECAGDAVRLADALAAELSAQEEQPGARIPQVDQILSEAVWDAVRSTRAACAKAEGFGVGDDWDVNSGEIVLNVLHRVLRRFDPEMTP